MSEADLLSPAPAGRFVNAAAPLPARLRDAYARALTLLGRRWVLHPDNRVPRKAPAAPRGNAP